MTCKYESVRRAALHCGLVEASEGDDCTLYWTDSSVTLDRLLGIKPYQKINHFPGMMDLCRKDMLAKNLNRMAKSFPKDYNIFPRTWCLPADYSDFQAYSQAKKHKTFICKPNTGSQGRGIFLVRSAREVPHGEHLTCQLYISKPFIIDGFKFDLRIYVLVTSCDPFHIFLHQEGLARFCTSHYCDPARANMEDACMHLTNYSINKRSENFVRDENAGSKRKLSALMRLLEQHSCDVAKLWLDIEDLVIKTLASAHSILSHNYHACFPRHSKPACFELLGFDVLLDHKLKPWLLEVNHSPSFATDSPLDREVKDRLLSDTLLLVNPGACERRKAESSRRRSSRASKQSKECRNVQAEEEAQRDLRTLRYEDHHLGGYKRIFPQEGGDKYSQFLQHSSSLFQETAASRAREECTRVQLQELYERQGGSGSRAEPRGGLEGDSVGENRRTMNRRTSSRFTDHNRTNKLAAGRPHFVPALAAVCEHWEVEGAREEEKHLRWLQRSAQLDPAKKPGPPGERGQDVKTAWRPLVPFTLSVSPLGPRRHPPSEPQLHSSFQPGPPTRHGHPPSFPPEPASKPHPQLPTHSTPLGRQARCQTKDERCPEASYGAQPPLQPSLSPEAPGTLGLFPPLGPQRQQSSSKASSGPVVHSWSVQESAGVSLCKLGSWKTRWPLTERGARGLPYLSRFQAGPGFNQELLVCPSESYGDLHVIAAPAPIHKRPS